MKDISSLKNKLHYPVMLDEVLKICNPKMVETLSIVHMVMEDIQCNIIVF